MGVLRLSTRCRSQSAWTEVLDHVPDLAQRFRLVLCKVVRHTRCGGVHVGPAKVFCRDFLTGGGFDQRWTCEEDGPIAFDDDRFV